MVQPVVAVWHFWLACALIALYVLALAPVQKRLRRLYLRLKYLNDPVITLVERMGGRYYPPSLFPATRLHFLVVMHTLQALKLQTVDFEMINGQRPEAGVSWAAPGRFLVWITVPLFEKLYQGFAIIVSNDQIVAKLISSERVDFAPAHRKRMHVAASATSAAFPTLKDRPERAALLFTLVNLALQFILLHETMHITSGHLIAVEWNEMGFVDTDTGWSTNADPILQNKLEFDADRGAVPYALGMLRSFEQWVQLDGALIPSFLAGFPFTKPADIWMCWALAVLGALVIMDGGRSASDFETAEHPFPSMRFERILQASSEEGMTPKGMPGAFELMKDLSSWLDYGGIDTGTLLLESDKFRLSGNADRLQQFLDENAPVDLMLIHSLEKPDRLRSLLDGQTRPVTEAVERLYEYLRLIPGDAESIPCSQDFRYMKNTRDFKVLVESLDLREDARKPSASPTRSKLRAEMLLELLYAAVVQERGLRIERP